MKGQTYIVLAIIFSVIIAIFAVINVEPVQVDYLFGTGQAPLILIILFSVLMGAVITAAVGVIRLIKLQREIKQLKQENNIIQTEEVSEVSLESDETLPEEPIENYERK
ncbi:lipopolysaccharide assembly LapA domain-containing protein [Gracilibacillus marinus]|uniref:Lipopolysaccharide assembly LapA domain-containing protein n=1 Tax=Gracilibacillus marinus TaxID=630535 RepID=A0ABV8VV40_9BACI